MLTLTGVKMQIKDILNLDARKKLIELSIWNHATDIDLQRKLVKGKFYAEEIIKIRLMTKRDISNYLRDIDDLKGVKEARKVKDPYFYRQFDIKVRTQIELYSYAYNRMLHLTPVKK